MEIVIHDGLEGFNHAFTCAWHGQFYVWAPYTANGQRVLYAICDKCVESNLETAQALAPVGLIPVYTHLACDCHAQRH